MPDLEPPRPGPTLLQRLRGALTLLTLVPLLLAGGLALGLGWRALSTSVRSIGPDLDRLSRVAASLSGEVQSWEVALRGVAQFPGLSALAEPDRRVFLERTRQSLGGVLQLEYHPQPPRGAGPLDPGSPPAVPGAGGEDPELAWRHQVAVESALEGKALRSRAVSPRPGLVWLVLAHPVRAEAGVVGAVVAWVDLGSALEVLRREFPDRRMSVRLVEGERVLATGGGGQAPLSEPGTTSPPGEEQVRLVSTPGGGASVLQGALPVGLPGWRLVWVYALPEVDAAFFQLGGAVVGSIAVASVLAWLLGGLLARRIAAPVEALSRSALAMAGGADPVEIPARTSYREVDALARSFETMRAHVLRAQGDNERLVRYTQGLLEARVEELRFLSRMSEASASREDVTGLGGLLLEQLWRLLPGSALCLWLKEGEGGLALLAHRGLGGEELARLEPPSMGGLTREGRALLEDPVFPDHQGQGGPGASPGEAGCLVALPVQGGVLGLLEVSMPAGSVLEDSALELLRVVGRELGLALENARLQGLSLAEKRFNEVILEEMGEGVLTLDPRGVVGSFNRAAERLTGLDRREVIGRPVEGLFRSSSAETPWAGLAGDGASAGPFELECSLPGGRKVLSFEPSVPPGGGAAGAYPSVIVVFRDVTRVRELEDLRREFTATLSHELRTPLTAVQGYLATLLHPRAPSDRERIREIVTDVATQVEHLSRLIEDLLEAAALKSGALEVHPRRVDLAGLVGERVARLRGEGGVAWRLEGEGQVWAWCDPDHLVYAVDHLLSNARKYSGPGAEVLVRVAREGHRALFLVKDSGVGIPPEHQERIFELYHRVEAGNSRRHYGAGVGLFVARRVVEAHGGSLRVESSPGVGSTFTVALPGAMEGEGPVG